VSEATDRPVDAGRAHRRRGDLSPETDELLTRYRTAMRRELAGILDELEPAPVPEPEPANVQTTWDGSAERPIPQVLATAGLGLVARRERWELAIKLARELAGGADADPPAQAGAGESRRAPVRAPRAPRLSARERKQLGG
jgi:hypothetical protein